MHLTGAPVASCGKLRPKLRSGCLLSFEVELSFSEVLTREFTQLTQVPGERYGPRNLAVGFIPPSMPPSISYTSAAATERYIVSTPHPEKHCGVRPPATASTHLRPSAGNMVMIGSQDFWFYAMNSASGEVRWKYETGLGISSSPAVSEDLVVVGSKDGFLYALQTQTGRLRWRTLVGEVVTAPPVIRDGVVYIQAGGTFALDCATGNVVWRAALAGAVQSAPVLAADTVYLAGLSGEVYALR